MSGHLDVAGRRIGAGAPVLVVAEMGVNHDGSVERALHLVDAAQAAGADALKLQMITARDAFARDSPSFPIFERAELRHEDWARVVERARALGLLVFATFASRADLEAVEAFGFPLVKVSSSNLTNLPLLEAVAGLCRPVILSTGLSYLAEVDDAVRFLEDRGATELALLHCTALYPTPPQDANLRAITTLASAFPEQPVGYSDHTDGIACATAAVALGASIVEKHFTLDRSLPGPDHAFSADPRGLRELVASVRAVEAALGSGRKRPAPGEVERRASWQRCLVAARDAAAGETIDLSTIAVKRSEGGGLPARLLPLLVGRRLRRPLRADEPLRWDGID